MLCRLILYSVLNIHCEHNTTTVISGSKHFLSCCDLWPGEWNTDLLGEAGWPLDRLLLPAVLPATDTAGRLARDWFDIPAGTPVSAAMGDLQCSVRQTLTLCRHRKVISVLFDDEILEFPPEAHWKT